MLTKGIVIGLTGPTGAGKSSVAKELAALGCAVVDCDRIARQVTDSCVPCLQSLAEEFGSDILQEGVLDRKLLAARAFASPEKTRKLNELTHPWILGETKAQIQAALDAGKPFVVVDAPLLFEAGVDALCDEIVAVTVPFEKRLQRIMKRDHISEELARARMAAQHPESWYEERAGKVISGRLDDETLRSELKAYLGGLSEETL